MTNSLFRIGFVTALMFSAGSLPAQADAKRAVDELLAVDRDYAHRAKSAHIVDALGAMFASDVIVNATGSLHHGRDAAIAMLRGIPDNQGNARIEWAPVRGGISGDGQHGFTYGFMTLVKADSTRVPLKYLSYWIKGPQGWKVAVYRRALRPAGEVSTAMREPSLPERMVPVSTDATAIAAHAKAVGDAEIAFSALGGKIGLGPAFTRNSAPDAMNMGGPQSADFLYGPEAIGAGVGAGESGPSKLTWGPDDRVLVASSGDLGVTIGHINAPAADGQPARRIPFFTVWKKIGGVWKFVAE